MKVTLLAMVLLSASVGVAAADPAPRGPDFAAALPWVGVDRSVVASDGTAPIDPTDIVAFSNASAVLYPSAVGQVDIAATWLLAHPHHRIVLQGHTDASGTAALNRELATERVASVRDRLIRRGVASDRILLVVYGAAEATLPVNPSERRVVMFASGQPIRALVTAALDDQQSLVARWTDRGTWFEEQRGLAPAPDAVITRR